MMVNTYIKIAGLDSNLGEFVIVSPLVFPCQPYLRTGTRVLTTRRKFCRRRGGAWHLPTDANSEKLPSTIFRNRWFSLYALCHGQKASIALKIRRCGRNAVGVFVLNISHETNIIEAELLACLERLFFEIKVEGTAVVGRELVALLHEHLVCRERKPPRQETSATLRAAVHHAHALARDQTVHPRRPAQKQKHSEYRPYTANRRVIPLPATPSWGLQLVDMLTRDHVLPAKARQQEKL